MSSAPVRVLALWSPDWPVTAAARAEHVPPHRPAAVVAAGRVLACTAVARAHGVRRGLRRREAEARCPDLAVLARDPGRDARAFEPVAVAVEELAPGVEIVRPGLLALPARGPVGWFGGEQAAAERIVDEVAARAGVECQVGLADGMFAAVLAARRGLAVAPGDSRAFLAPLGVEELDREPDVDRSDLVDLLHRLGLRSLGAFAALDVDDVASRFGADAVLGHRLARGLDPRPPARRTPPEELSVEIELDPPVDRVDAAAFAARGLAERLHATLAGHGLSCTRLGIAARTDTGEELRRIWRCAEPLTPAGTVDRVRWQLDAWLTAAGLTAADRPASGRPASAGSFARSPARGRPGAVTLLRLVPEETVPAGALQLGLWGDVCEADERAGRAMVRVQALLGPDAVVTAVLVGGRDPAERARLVPWGDERGPDVDVSPPPDAAPSPARSGPPPVAAVPPGGLLAGTPAASGLVSDGPVTGAPVTNAPAAGVLALAGPSGEVPPPRPHMIDDVERATGGEARCPRATAVTPTPDGHRGTSRGRPASRSTDGNREPGMPGSRYPDVDQAPDGAPAGSGASITPPAGPRPPIVEPPARGPGTPAPAGWPDDVLRATGRVSGAHPDGPPAHRPRSTNARRRPPSRPSTAGRVPQGPPASWPGQVPTPSPATVPPTAVPAALTDAHGHPVGVTDPDLLAAVPHRLAVDGGPGRAVVGWAGPWPVAPRWWLERSPEPGSRLQVVLDDGSALLLLARDGRWEVVGVYD